MRTNEEWPIIGVDIGFIKYANAEIVNIMTSPAQQAVLAGLMKPMDAQTKEAAIDKSGAYEKFKSIVSELKKVAPKSEDFLYVHVRAITAMEAGCLCKQGGYSCTCGAEGIKVNSNGDAFPEEELVKGYKTFIAKGNFVDHESSQIDKIRGIIIDAHWNPEGKYVECLLAVDRKSHPQLARDIETGVVHGVSMGCQVAESECSICHNKAQMESQYCGHIKGMKGLRYGNKTVYEVNRGLNFIELSWVTNPADSQCTSIRKIAKQENNISNRQRSLNRNMRKQQVS